jgi:Spy/CpxP family protein refolding chaperone
MKTIFAMVLTAATLSWVSLSYAQPSKKNGQAAPGAVDTVDKRERVKQKVRTMRAYVLTDALNLDPSTGGKMFPVIEKYDTEQDALIASRTALRAQLESSTDSKVLNKVIDDLIANQKALSDLETKRLTELRAILTPQQIAKLMVVLPDFERRLQQRLAKREEPKDSEQGKPDRSKKPNPFGEAAPEPRKGKPGGKEKCNPFTDPTGCNR